MVDLDSNPVEMEEICTSKSFPQEVTAPVILENSIQIKRSSSDEEDDDSYSYSPSAAPIRKRQRLEMSVNETMSNFLSYCQCMKNNHQEFKLTSDNRKKIQEIKHILMEIDKIE